MATPSFRVAPALTSLVLLLGSVAAAQATQVQHREAKRNKPPTSVKIVPSSSQESEAARTRRLKRECKGRPNAGACLGHAS